MVFARFFTKCWVVALCAGTLSPAVAQVPKTIDFNRDVRPILSNNCFQCHGPDEKTRKARLRLDTPEGAATAIVPGQPDASELIIRITASPDDASRMPPAKTGKTLGPRDVAILQQWVQQGAKYAPHWAYVPPKPPVIPTTQFRTVNPIDAFLWARLEQEGLKPQPEADRYTLARRVALDLTGLPPTLEEAEAFVTDTAADAYEKFVDRQLAKPAFGEHWARLWLDLARYADSAGYADDPLRTIWKYRDYVIESFNANKPFDQFTIEQLAGDLLPQPTIEQLVATAFHRNTMTNSEGGTSDEEFRNVAVVDRVNTTFTVWMGTSIGCAQCHTHKYDPITQKEYFEVFAFFNNTADADRPDESPTLPFWSLRDFLRKMALEQQIAALEAELKGKKPEELKPQRDRLATLKKELAALKPATSVPIMKELVGPQRRKTRIQFRGNFLDLGDEVREGVPAVFHPFPEGMPKNRLGFARWLISRENPLTARVIANRFWEQIFGTGIVRTSEEFGIQGELPSHPELLDWLALDFQRDWNVKRFLKQLVMSAAYRQSAAVTAAQYERDPDNRLLARGPRVRLTAEMIRDQALFAAGLLSPKMLGPSVRPFQPSLGVSAAFGGSIDWKMSDGEDRYRRGIYTQWRRSNPYPSMSTFDAPNRDTCVVRRNRTNTPLQALVLMNDPVYVEAAQALAQKARTSTSTPDEAVVMIFRRCLIRPPSPEEQKRLVQLFTDARAAFQKAPAQAQQFAGNQPTSRDPATDAALTLVASVVLNLDEMVMKR
ncbi:MAG: PSD1 and planctomycete cytochrome C domain-containing protein [Gemmataceae bacterium]|nr:PSD1 and planctomycete cytochrome C domain-containing protein [Gemmata sp.]MDW8197916.1 PSD1 and planctomycete cytochrome C domain-containing protein [Gemmataceae bacterium]